MNTEDVTKAYAALPAIEEIVAEGEHNDPVVVAKSVTKTRYEAHYSDAGRVVWEAITEKVTITPEQQGETKLNRAQRRQLQRYIAHKARVQMRHVLKVSHNARMAHIESLARPCPRCGLDMIGVLRESTIVRCQCKATMKRHG